jgi:hypothetical protein
MGHGGARKSSPGDGAHGRVDQLFASQDFDVTSYPGLLHNLETIREYTQESNIVELRID